MDLLSIFLALWRHKVGVLAVVSLTAVGGAFVLVGQPSVYEASATLLLVPPPRAPTDEPADTAAMDNPYTRAYDPGIVINVVAAGVTSDAQRDELVNQGADPRYDVAQTVRYGFASPVAEIGASADSAEGAKRTVELVIGAFQAQLREIQSVEQVAERYFIGTRVVDPPEPGTVLASGKMRSLLAVFGLGLIGVLTVVTTSDAIAKFRADHGRQPSRRREREEEVAWEESDRMSRPPRQLPRPALGPGPNGRASRAEDSAASAPPPAPAVPTLRPIPALPPPARTAPTERTPPRQDPPAERPPAAPATPAVPPLVEWQRPVAPPVEAEQSARVAEREPSVPVDKRDPSSERLVAAPEPEPPVQSESPVPVAEREPPVERVQGDREAPLVGVPRARPHPYVTSSRVAARDKGTDS